MPWRAQMYENPGTSFLRRATDLEKKQEMTIEVAL